MNDLQTKIHFLCTNNSSTVYIYLVQIGSYIKEKRGKQKGEKKEKKEIEKGLKKRKKRENAKRNKGKRKMINKGKKGK